jgi:hypothetical protein
VLSLLTVIYASVLPKEKRGASIKLCCEKVGLGVRQSYGFVMHYASAHEFSTSFHSLYIHGVYRDREIFTVHKAQNEHEV